MIRQYNIVLVGNPNSGKSTLFNILTGLNQKISNFPGTTVEQKTGVWRVDSKRQFKIIDTPGTYSLFPKSNDERVTVNTLLNRGHENYPDLILVVADASNLKRSLLLATEVIDLGMPVVLALSMNDQAQRKGIHIREDLLSEQLGIPVIKVNGRQQTGIEELKNRLMNQSFKPSSSVFSIPDAMRQMLDELAQVTGETNAYKNLIQAHRWKEVDQIPAEARRILDFYEFNPEAWQSKETLERFRIIDDVLIDVTERTTHFHAQEWSGRIDGILTHRIGGYVIFFSILFLLFQSIFSLAKYPMDFIESAFTQLASYATDHLPKGLLSELLVDGIIAGLSGVVVFLPQIIILFFFIALLEDSGYMARVSFIMDRLMRIFGLNGKSVVPLIGGLACAVPSIMAARNIENRRERLITIMVTPLMSCSARLPVYTLLISLVTPADYLWGVVNRQGLYLFGMYLLGFFSAILLALVFKWTTKETKKAYFIMELPGYKWPVARNIILTLRDKTKAFLYGAGKIIVAVSVLLWFAGTFGPADTFERINRKYDQLRAQGRLPEAELTTHMKAEKLENSFAGQFGHFIEPAIKPLGFNWKIGISLLSSLAAREVFVGTMTTLYHLESQDDTQALGKHMLDEVNPVTLKPVYSPAVVWSLLLFYAFALQCTSTIAVVYRETGGWKWPAIQFTVLTALAYGVSLLTYNLLK